ncbi:ZF-HD homeobox protein [Platanthera zijinensis]|uniref:ZF-HD homeobox protein n=1 Tax=Platanthera zijinensis TaxID=2320716 RepID=A0AAP0B069_9ASPA
MNISSHDGEIPIPITSSYVVHSPPLQHHPKLHPSNGPPPPQAPTPLSVAAPLNSKKSVLVKYRECLKNHAACIGGNATDGCGEFMPSGEEGTLEALKCSACNCHRNFHRKEVEGDLSPCELFHFKGGRKMMGQKNSLIPRPSPHPMIMPFGAIQTSESDEMEGYGEKRFRTKFTSEQKEKMLAFAERVGWRLQKQEESMVQQLCQDIGIRRRVFKVWMHNNKHIWLKKTVASSWIEVLAAQALPTASDL